MIHNVDKPGSIGSMGVTLGKHNINISRMMVGREDDGDRILFSCEPTALCRRRWSRRSPIWILWSVCGPLNCDDPVTISYFGDMLF